MSDVQLADLIRKGNTNPVMPMPEDWELLDKQWFPSAYQQMHESGQEPDSWDSDDFQFKCVYVFRCRNTGKLRIEQIVGPLNKEIE